MKMTAILRVGDRLCIDQNILPLALWELKIVAIRDGQVEIECASDGVRVEHAGGGESKPVDE